MVELNMSPDRADETVRWDWRGVEWDDLTEYVAKGMQELEDHPIETIEDFERELKELNTS